MTKGKYCNPYAGLTMAGCPDTCDPPACAASTSPGTSNDPVITAPPI